MTIFKYKFVFCCALLLSIALPKFAFAEIAIIVSQNSSVSSSDASELERLYLGKTKSVGGSDVTALNQKKGSVSDAFNKKVLKKSSSQVKAYWSKLVFTGKGTPPKELGSDAEVIAEVSKDANAIGYVSKASVTADVKVLLEL